jgi:hypothetical protein
MKKKFYEIDTRTTLGFNLVISSAGIATCSDTTLVIKTFVLIVNW